MALVVEDGTGLANSDAFASLEYVATYHTNMGNTDWAIAQPIDQEAAIRRATQYLSTGYVWKGYPVKGRDQALAWPRHDVVDEEGYYVPYDAVPREVQIATAEYALRELQQPGYLNPDVDMGARISSETIGEISVDYELGDVNTYYPTIRAVDDLISGLLADGGSAGAPYVGQAYRW